MRRRAARSEADQPRRAASAAISSRNSISSVNRDASTVCSDVWLVACRRYSSSGSRTLCRVSPSSSRPTVNAQSGTKRHRVSNGAGPTFSRLRHRVGHRM